MKKPYSTPKIEIIKIDTEISIVMMTTIPPDPGKNAYYQYKDNRNKKKETFASPFE
ncbi:MAG: hypothetical protein HN704_03040 [Bacteroidetes bacterium]|jgi:hypothetical protein|nr:hypothetical protein [Bacteroidota bacterium]MBT7142621.1 hypothetical protein [Bacteroidota bacterium]MBT7490564.1 hypothetical protein [Bacteroidota bacterium]